MHILYGTTACHLCERAQTMLDELGVAYRYQDISESDVLFERYGLLIPVLSHAVGGELNWPFESVQIREFIQRTKPE